MSSESLRTAGIVLVVFPTVVFGGASLLWHWITRQTSYYDNPLRRSLWRARIRSAEFGSTGSNLALRGQGSWPSRR